MTQATIYPPILCRNCLAFEPGLTVPCRHCSGKRLVIHPELADLAIAHIDCDAFYASVEKRDDPSLRGKPLLIGHAGGRGVVTTACYVARKFGPRSAMPMFKALQLCPDAIIRPPDMAKYKATSRQIRSIFADESDLFEPVSIDEAYLDLHLAHRRHGEPAAVALARISRRVEREVGVTVSIGLAPNKFLAKLASDLDKPRGYSVIGESEASDFLAPLSVRKIHGVGAATAERMEQAGFSTIADLQGLSEGELVARFGRFGHRLAQFAHGRDEREVEADRPTKSVSAETTFSVDMRDPTALLAELQPLCERVSQRLVAAGLAGGSVVVKLKTSDFQSLTRSRQLAAPTQRAALLFETAQGLVQREADGRAFRLIGIGVADLAPGSAADPPSLFDDF